MKGQLEPFQRGMGSRASQGASCSLPRPRDSAGLCCPHEPGDALLHCPLLLSHLLQRKSISSLNLYTEKYVKHFKRKPMQRTAVQEKVHTSIPQVEVVLLSGRNLGFSFFTCSLRKRARMPVTGWFGQVGTAALWAHVLPAWVAVTWYLGSSQNRCCWQQLAQSIPAQIPTGTRKYYLSNYFQTILAFILVIQWLKRK